MSILEKVAYLKGLAEGLGLDSETKEGKLITHIIDALSDMAVEINELCENALNIGDELDNLSTDLASIEEILLGGDDFDDDDDDDDEYEDFFGFGDEDGVCNCGFCGGNDFSYVIECDTCGLDIALDDATLSDGMITCPSCGEEFEFEFDDGEDDDDFDDDLDDDDDDDDADEEEDL